ncbi:MAG: NAD(P)H-binding protein [Corynebacteriales bacterium]|nr:NAD(P)H-binding protein [Mycobacteriales bacterium]
MIVVTGATGNVGRALVGHLLDADRDVTAVARNINGAHVPPGVKAVAADLADPQSLTPAFDGATALFLLVAGEDPKHILETAKRAGITKVVLLSTQGAATRPHIYQHAVRFEEAVRDSGMRWTILRSGGMASNALAWVEPIREHGIAAAPFANVGLPFIDPEDVAAVSAAVLREDQHHGTTYTLTGPELSTPRQRAATLAKATSRPIQFIEQTREEAHSLMTKFMPAQVAEGTLAILGTPTPEEQQISPDVTHVLGREPQPFSAWAARHATLFK